MKKDSGRSGFFFISCREKRCIYTDEGFQRLTGHDYLEFMDKGLEKLVSLIHPDDIRRVQEGVKEILNSLDKYCGQGIPFILEYRIRTSSGMWIWVREEKYILTEYEGAADRIFSRITDITPARQQTEDQFWNTTGHRRFLHQLFASSGGSSILPRLTKREADVLRLIGEGYSTKMIAAQLYLSTHTVESYRRNLLQKFEVSNSSALIRQASKILSVPHL